MNFRKMFPDYDCDENGNIYKSGERIKQFNSNGYKQVLLFDEDHNRHVLGVHTVIAMKYLPYFKGCVVHHKDGNKWNNAKENLEVLTHKEHAAKHETGKELTAFRKNTPPWNKGMKMSEEFRSKCSDSAKRRWKKQNIAV